MVRQIELYKLKATNTEVVMSTITATTEGTTVYFNHNYIRDNRTEISDALISGDIVAIAVDGVTEMTLDDALHDLAFVGDMADVNNLDVYTNQVRWNLEIAPQLISSVRGEMLETDLNALGLSGPILLSKLANIIGALQVGMYKEAWQMFSVLERDAFLTDERINRYIDKLSSADAITYV